MMLNSYGETQTFPWVGWAFHLALYFSCSNRKKFWKAPRRFVCLLNCLECFPEKKKKIKRKKQWWTQSACVLWGVETDPRPGHVCSLDTGLECPGEQDCRTVRVEGWSYQDSHLQNRHRLPSWRGTKDVKFSSSVTTISVFFEGPTFYSIYFPLWFSIAPTNSTWLN